LAQIEPATSLTMPSQAWPWLVLCLETVFEADFLSSGKPGWPWKVHLDLLYNLQPLAGLLFL